MPVRTPFVSIVLPVLNEAPLIRSFLLHIRAVAREAEIIVVDGGSHDGTASIAEPLADVVISARQGRASQMNAGAAVARGEVLWFLHADLQVPRDSLREIEQALDDSGTVGGCFRLRFPERQHIYRISDSVGNIGVDVFGFALGDHGIFCRREVFNQIGGYRDVPILEDAEIYRALRSRGWMVQLRDEIHCSPRAYLKYGAYWTTAVYFLILALYVAGIQISRLNRIYRWFRGSAVGIARARQLANA
jgi:rSAM/selenodomain-associated transferase 2